MSIFHKIMDVFFEETDDSSNPGASRPAPQTSVPNDPQRAPHSQPPTRQNRDVRVYNRFVESLQKAIETANLPGFDFFEFRQLYNRFLAEGKGASDAIRDALTSAETMRVSKNTLIANYQHYVRVLAEQEKLFEVELKNFVEESITGPRSEQSRMEQETEEKRLQIKQLEAEIEALKGQMQKLSAGRSESEVRIEDARASFRAAYESVAGELKEVADKLKAL